MMKTRYVRLYADADGESHFSDEEMELTSVNFAPPAPPINVSAITPAKDFVFLHCSEGWFGDWHPTPYRQFFFFLTGEAEVGVSDGEVRRFGPGNILLVEDTTAEVIQPEFLLAKVWLRPCNWPNLESGLIAIYYGLTPAALLSHGASC